ncbi:MAG: cyclic nucleotide-gated ion channel/potassium channel family protein [Rhodospirillales bacterium]|nr:cyclic nucleotide-gated ion channel/potassium channel family protein [Rhodospirillales bacterium]
MTDISLRANVHRIIETGGGSLRYGRFFDLAMIILILTNVIAVTLESVPEFDTAYGDYFVDFDIFSIMVFTLEYVARIWVCMEEPIYQVHGPVMGRLQYMLTPLAIVDLLSILPFYLGFLLVADLRFIRVFRLLRLLKLTRYSPALQTVGAVLREQRRPLAASLVIMLTLLVFGAGVSFLLEHDAQPEAFRSIPHAMWWTMSTLATVGYGDVVPVTIGGKIFGGLIMLLGIAMYALPTGILALGFAEEFRRHDFMVTWRLVARVPLFAQLEASAIADIARLLKPKVVPARYVIVRAGEEATTMFMIVSGDVQVELAPVPLHLGPGNFFGEIALIEKCRRTATVTALTECHLLVLSADQLHRFEASHPELHATIRNMAEERRAKLNNAAELA